MRGFALAAVAALCVASNPPRLRPGDRLREFLSGGTIEERIRDLRSNPKLQGGNDAQVSVRGRSFLRLSWLD